MILSRLLHMDALGRFRFYVKDWTRIEHFSLIEHERQDITAMWNDARLHKRCSGIIIAHGLTACATTCFWVLAL